MLFRNDNKTPKNDPRPVAVEDCPDCWAPAGGRHEWSCERVPAEAFRAFLASIGENVGETQPPYPHVIDGQQKALAALQVNLMTGGQPDRTKCMVRLTDFWRSAADMCQEPRTHRVEVYSYEAGFATGGIFSPATTCSAACDKHTEEIRVAPGFIDAYPINNPA